MADHHQTTRTPNTDALSRFVLGTRERPLPPDVMNAALFGIVDWFGVALGAEGQEPVAALKRVVQGWQGQGASRILLGGVSSAPGAALVNGTMAHTLDFDDTHVGSIAHLSGPTLAAALAVGNECGASAQEILQAYVTGFEVGGRVGNAGLGVAVNERHIHATGVFGCLGAAAAAAVLYRLDDLGVRRALGLAATQVAGLTGSFGTPAKPFHAGKAAMNGVLAAQMAREGFPAGMDLLETGAGLDRALVQDKSVQVHAVDFSDGWEITRNTFKPYASCLLTHPVIDAGRQLAPELAGRPVAKIQVLVHPLAIQLAGKPAPATPFEGKFSLAFCTALSLCGRTAMQTDFTAASVAEPRLRELLAVVELLPSPEIALTEARLLVMVADGDRLSAHTPLALGNPSRPMSWQDMQAKFTSLVEPVMPGRAGELFSMLSRFDRQQDLPALMAMLGRTKT